MKKLIVFVSILFISIACQNEVKTNNPAFEAEKDNVFWKATSSKVTSNPSNPSGFVLNAYTGNEVLTISVPNKNPNTYDIGTTGITVSYTYTNGNIVKHFEANSNIGDGTVVVKQETETGKFTGTFSFNLEDENGEKLNFNKGTFYKVGMQ